MIDWTRNAETIPQVIERLQTLIVELELSDSILEATEVACRLEAVAKDCAEAAWTRGVVYPRTRNMSMQSPCAKQDAQVTS